MPGVSAEDGLAGAAGAGAGAVLRPQPPSVLHPHLGRLPPPGDDDGDDDDVNDDDNDDDNSLIGNNYHQTMSLITSISWIKESHL